MVKWEDDNDRNGVVLKMYKDNKQVVVSDRVVCRKGSRISVQK